jgi:pyrroloquinoline quinone biosynthesis protein D
MLNLNQSLKLRKGYRLQWEETQQQWVILFPEGMIQLNDTAGLILQLFESPHVISEAIAQLEARFPQQPITQDVIEFLEDAHEQRWLEPA